MLQEHYQSNYALYIFKTSQGDKEKEMKNRNKVVAGIKKIIWERFPTALYLFEMMLEKAITDKSYKKHLDSYLRRGSTLALRSLISGFGDYSASDLKGREFRNCVNTIDTAHHLYYEEHCKIGNNNIIESIRDVLIERWPESEALFDQVLDKTASDETYSRKVKAYFSRFGEKRGSTLLLREITSSFGDYFGQDSEGIAFKNNVDAIDAAHGVVGEEIPSIASLLG